LLAHLNNEKAPPVAETTDEAVDPNVRVHVKAGTSSIVPHSLGRKQECAMEAREIKGLEIASGSKFTRQGHLWLVPSQHGSKKYAVDLNATPPRCTCPDSEQSGQKCKHIFAAEHAAKLQESGGSVPAPTEPAKRPTYKQEWREYNLAQTREKAYFQTLLYQLCQGLDEPVRKGRGRPSVKMADLIFAACVKVYEGISGRRNQTDLREARERGFLSRQVHYNTIFKYLDMESLTPYLHHLITETSLALKEVEVDFAVDSSGFSTCQYVRWFDVKHGGKED